MRHEDPLWMRTAPISGIRANDVQKFWGNRFRMEPQMRNALRWDHGTGAHRINRQHMSNFWITLEKGKKKMVIRNHWGILQNGTPRPSVLAHMRRRPKGMAGYATSTWEANTLDVELSGRDVYIPDSDTRITGCVYGLAGSAPSTANHGMVGKKYFSAPHMQSAGKAPFGRRANE